VLAKNFGVPAGSFKQVLDPSALYIFAAPVPGPLGTDKVPGPTGATRSFSHRMTAQSPIKTGSGTVRITDSSVFLESKTIAAALVEVAPGGLRELHWHPNVDEWQYYIEGEGRMGVFGASGQARTFDYHAGDVGYVPFAMGHYIENTGTTPLRFLEMFKSSYYADLSLDQWIALTPPELVNAHLRLDSRSHGRAAQAESPRRPGLAAHATPLPGRRPVRRIVAHPIAGLRAARGTRAGARAGESVAGFQRLRREPDQTGVPQRGADRGHGLRGG